MEQKIIIICWGLCFTSMWHRDSWSHLTFIHCLCKSLFNQFIRRRFFFFFFYTQHISVKLYYQKPCYTFKRVSMKSRSAAQRHRRLLYTEVHTFTPGVVSLSSVDPVLPRNILIVFIFILVILLRKKTTSGITFTKHLVYLNGNIFSCLNRKYLISRRWWTWRSSQRLWKENWKFYHIVMSRKYTLSTKTWSITCTKAAVSPVSHAH